MKTMTKTKGNYALVQKLDRIQVTYYPDGNAPVQYGHERAPQTLAEVQKLARSMIPWSRMPKSVQREMRQEIALWTTERIRERTKASVDADLQRRQEAREAKEAKEAAVNNIVLELDRDNACVIQSALEHYARLKQEQSATTAGNVYTRQTAEKAARILRVVMDKIMATPLA